MSNEGFVVEVTSEVKMNVDSVDVLQLGRPAEQIITGTDVDIELYCKWLPNCKWLPARARITHDGVLLQREHAHVLSSAKLGNTWRHRVWIGDKTVEEVNSALIRFMEANGWFPSGLATEDIRGGAYARLKTEMVFTRRFSPNFPDLWALIIHMLKCVGEEITK